MQVAILGSEELEVEEDDIFRFASRCVYPHTISCVITSGYNGIASSAEVIAQEHSLPFQRTGDFRTAVDCAASVVIIRTSKERPYVARYCAKKGRPFKEFVVVKEKNATSQ